MDTIKAIEALRQSKPVQWPSESLTHDFALALDRDSNLVSFRDEFIVPSKAQLKRKSLEDNQEESNAVQDQSDSAIYFCGNSLGLQAKAVSSYVGSYLKTWSSIAVGGHFTQLESSPLKPYQDMAAECATHTASIVGAKPSEVVIMNTLTVNLHLMMAAFYKPTEKRHKIMCEWRPFPSDWYAIESQIEWHGRIPEQSMLPIQPDEGTYNISTSRIIEMIDKHADELALILLPGIQYYSGQLLDIPTITEHAHSRGLTIGWDLAHAAGNVELELHKWNVDFACWCTYKYMNGGAGSIAGAFVHERHGTVSDVKGLRGWYGGDKSVRFLMDNKFVPTPGAQGFQVANPSAIDLTCLLASLSVFNKTTMSKLRSRSLLLTAYAEHLLQQMQSSVKDESERPFNVITPSDPMARGAQLSVLIREDLMDGVSQALEGAGIICDKRKPGCIRVAPVPMYNTFADVWRFMQVFERSIQPTKN